MNHMKKKFCWGPDDIQIVRPASKPDRDSTQGPGNHKTSRPEMINKQNAYLKKAGER